MNIPFASSYITNDEIDAVVAVLRSGWLTMGEETVEFENKFATYVGSKYAVATSSCTAALFLSLKVLGIKEGVEVITTPFTFAATANAIVHCGARPVFVDIDERTYNIDPEKIEGKLTENAKMIVVVHYGGQPASMNQIMAIAKEHDLKIIEDAAHATGSCYENGDKAGSLGHLACFSFYATKPMTTGEGGMITLDDGELAERLKILRLHGMSKDAWKRYEDSSNWYYDVVEAGYKCNPTDINCAMGLEQLKKLDWMNRKRGQIAEFYNENLRDLEIILPYTDPKIKSSYHLYPIRLLNYDRDDFMKKMATKNIGTSVHFIPLHLMTFYQKNCGYTKGDFPISEKVFKNIVTIPIYPQLTNEQLEYIISCIKEILLGTG